MFKKFFNVVYDERGRRKWDTKDFKPVAPEIKADKKLPMPKLDYSRPLTSRSESVGLEAHLGVHKFTAEDAQSSKFLGFHCPLCDVSMNDSNSWLDHLNSTSHNQRQGTQMKVEKVTPSSVDARLEMLRRKKAQRGAAPQKRMKTDES
jgi:U4/U6.U5 tri-snRNP component SNU23